MFAELLSFKVYASRNCTLSNVFAIVPKVALVKEQSMYKVRVQNVALKAAVEKCKILYNTSKHNRRLKIASK